MDRLARMEFTEVGSSNSDYYIKIMLTFAYDNDSRLSEMHDIVCYGDEQTYYFECRWFVHLIRIIRIHIQQLLKPGLSIMMPMVIYNKLLEIMNWVAMMSTVGDSEWADENWMEWGYTSYLNETLGLDFNVMSNRNLFGSYNMAYRELTNMRYALRILGKNSKNLVKIDLVNRSYNTSETRKAIDHEDAWTPYEYAFTPDNYLDVVTARCTLKTYEDGKLTDTSYIDDEYTFTYE